MLNQDEKSCLTVFSQRLTADLMLKGHRLIEMRPDRRYPERNVFFFLNTEEVRKDMDILRNKYRKESLTNESKKHRSRNDTSPCF